jgi:acyl carrier protein
VTLLWLSQRVVSIRFPFRASYEKLPDITKSCATFRWAVSGACKRDASLETLGLDAVEIILRAEELFAIDIGDEEAAKVETVGQFYELICSKLHVSLLQSPVTSEVLPVITHREKVFLVLNRHTPLPAPADALPWSAQGAWDCVVAVFVDQQGLRTNDVTYHARIARDLGVD